MSRPASAPTSRLGRVCCHFGLQQRELAVLLGISPALATQLATGRRAFSRSVHERLAPFLAALDAATPDDTPAPATPPSGPLDAGPLEKRRAACLHEARNLRWKLRTFPAQVAVAAHWAAARPVLLAALPPAPPAAAPATPEAVRLRAVHAWLDQVPLALPPDVLAEWHLLHQRALALEAEAAALATLLIPAAP